MPLLKGTTSALIELTEIYVMVQGIPKWVNGITPRTTCDDVICALLLEQGLDNPKDQAKYFTLTEIKNGNKKNLKGKSKVLKVMGNQNDNQVLIMEKVGSVPKNNLYSTVAHVKNKAMNLFKKRKMPQLFNITHENPNCDEEQMEYLQASRASSFGTGLPTILQRNSPLKGFNLGSSESLENYEHLGSQRPNSPRYCSLIGLYDSDSSSSSSSLEHQYMTMMKVSRESSTSASSIEESEYMELMHVLKNQERQLVEQAERIKNTEEELELYERYTSLQKADVKHEESYYCTVQKQIDDIQALLRQNAQNNLKQEMDIKELDGCFASFNDKLKEKDIELQHLAKQLQSPCGMADDWKTYLSVSNVSIGDLSSVPNITDDVKHTSSCSYYQEDCSQINLPRIGEEAMAKVLSSKLMPEFNMPEQSNYANLNNTSVWDSEDEDTPSKETQPRVISKAGYNSFTGSLLDNTSCLDSTTSSSDNVQIRKKLVKEFNKVNTEIRGSLKAVVGDMTTSFITYESEESSFDSIEYHSGIQRAEISI